VGGGGGEALKKPTAFQENKKRTFEIAMLPVRVPPSFNFLNQLTNLHEISYELHATGRHANATFPNFLPSAAMLSDTSTTYFQLW
jgi:hypothetical protein